MPRFDDPQQAYLWALENDPESAEWLRQQGYVRPTPIPNRTVQGAAPATVVADRSEGPSFAKQAVNLTGAGLRTLWGAASTALNPQTYIDIVGQINDAAGGQADTLAQLNKRIRDEQSLAPIGDAARDAWRSVRIGVNTAGQNLVNNIANLPKIIGNAAAGVEGPVTDNYFGDWTPVEEVVMLEHFPQYNDFRDIRRDRAKTELRQNTQFRRLVEEYIRAYQQNPLFGQILGENPDILFGLTAGVRQGFKQGAKRVAQPGTPMTKADVLRQAASVGAREGGLNVAISPNQSLEDMGKQFGAGAGFGSGSTIVGSILGDVAGGLHHSAQQGHAQAQIARMLREGDPLTMEQVMALNRADIHDTPITIDPQTGTVQMGAVANVNTPSASPIPMPGDVAPVSGLPSISRDLPPVDPDSLVEIDATGGLPAIEETPMSLAERQRMLQTQGAELNNQAYNESLYQPGPTPQVDLSPYEAQLQASRYATTDPATYDPTIMVDPEVQQIIDSYHALEELERLQNEDFTGISDIDTPVYDQIQADTARGLMNTTQGAIDLAQRFKDQFAARQIMEPDLATTDFTGIGDIDTPVYDEFQRQTTEGLMKTTEGVIDLANRIKDQLAVAAATRDAGQIALVERTIREFKKAQSIQDQKILDFVIRNLINMEETTRLERQRREMIDMWDRVFGREGRGGLPETKPRIRVRAETTSPEDPGGTPRPK